MSVMVTHFDSVGFEFEELVRGDSLERRLQAAAAGFIDCTYMVMPYPYFRVPSLLHKGF